MEEWENYQIAFENYIEAAKLYYDNKKIDNSFDSLNNAIRNLKLYLKTEGIICTNSNKEFISNYITNILGVKDIDNLDKLRKMLNSSTIPGMDWNGRAIRRIR